MKKIRVLNIIGGLERGGAETFIVNVYRNINKELFEFDFAIYDKPSGEGYYDEILEMGAQVYFIPKKSRGIIRSLYHINKLVNRENYDVIWRHGSGALALLDLEAAKGRNRLLVFHSHNSEEKGLGRILHGLLCRYFNKKEYIVRFACGEKAGKYFYGNRKFNVIKNGISLKNFVYDINKRNEIRDRYELTNKYVIGHIGRLVEQKNQLFLIKIFAELCKIREDLILIIVGDGKLRTELQTYAVKKNISEKVLFFGVIENINEIACAFDLFAMPSIYEGFPVALVEMQALGITCLVSDNIDREVDLTGNVRFLSLDDNILWVKEMIRSVESDKPYDELANGKIAEKGYDIAKTVEQIQSIFMNMLSNNKENTD